MRTKLVAGNWKMNGSRAQTESLLRDLRAALHDSPPCEVLVCPGFPYLQQAADLIAGSGIRLGAQNLAIEDAGAFTGEVAGPMLADQGCEYVLVGHSERRSLFGEDSDTVAKKYVAAQRAGLKPVLCVGESLEEREAGTTERVIEAQLQAVLDLAGVDSLASAVIAYEPVWAIGTGKTATPDQAQEVHAFIRGKLATLDPGVAAGVRILYGGSMNPGNAAELLAMQDIDGGLIGGASLKPDDFLAIGKAANN